MPTLHCPSTAHRPTGLLSVSGNVEWVGRNKAFRAHARISVSGKLPETPPHATPFDRLRTGWGGLIPGYPTNPQLESSCFKLLLQFLEILLGLPFKALYADPVYARRALVDLHWLPSNLKGTYPVVRSFHQTFAAKLMSFRNSKCSPF